MSKLRVLVVGASIAGPSTAYWFAKAGASVTVIERFPQLRTGGQNIDIRTAGVTVMRKIPGMEAAVRAKNVDIEGISLVRDDGRPYGVLRPTGNPDQQSLVSEYEIFRGDLSQILVDLTKDNKNVKYIYNEQVAAIQQNEKGDGPVTVEFMNGSPTSEYDLVVACDGSTSRTRAIGLGCGVRDHIEPTNCWSAYFSTKEDFLKGSKIGHGYSAVGGRFIAVGPDPATGGNRVNMTHIHTKDDHAAVAAFREAQKQGELPLKQFMVRNYRGIGWITDDLIQAMMQSDDFYASETVKVTTPSIYKGRFVMVGDAGYAPSFTGGGTTLAMTGAYVLAGEINKHKGDLTAGLQAYEKTMRPLITEMQKVPFIVPAAMGPQTAWGIWFRNSVFAFITWSGVVEFLQKYVAGAFASTEEYPLPEYKWEE